MAAIDSPRRILGERDVNKPLVTKQVSISNSPSKATSFSHNNIWQEKSLDLCKTSQALLSPKINDTSPTPSPEGSMLGSRKRGAVCLGNVQDGPPRKQTAIGLPEEAYNGNRPRISDREMRPLQSPGDDCRVKLAATEAISDSGSLRWSVSTDSSFDATQDSELHDSRVANITEQEAIVPDALTELTIAPVAVRRLVSQDEARENAEALRLRLKVAMYKVKTNQTDLPLSQLQIRSSRACHSMRNPLPTLRLAPAPAPHHSKSVTLASLSPEFRKDEVKNHTSLPSSSPPSPTGPNQSVSHVHEHRFRGSTTPILPRSRDTYSHHHSRGSSEPRTEVTSNGVKGCVADGLLSLMGGVSHRS